MNKKSLTRHMRDKHSQRRPSVSSMASAIDQQMKSEKQGKRKPDDSLSPPISQPDPKKNIPLEDSPKRTVDSGSPILRVGSGSGDNSSSLKAGTGGN